MNDITDRVTVVREMADYVETSNYSLDVDHQAMTVTIQDNFENNHICLVGEQASEFILQAEELYQSVEQQVDFDTCLLANVKNYI